MHSSVRCPADPSFRIVVRLPKNRVVFFTISINFGLFHTPSVTSFRWRMWRLIRAIVGETAVACQLQSQLQLRPISATIALCKHHIGGVTKPQLRLFVFLLECSLMSLNVTQAYRPTCVIHCGAVFWRYNLGCEFHNGPTEKCSLIDINSWINVTWNNISSC